MIKNIFAGALLLAAAGSAAAWDHPATPTTVKVERARGAVENPEGLTGSPSGYEVFVQGAVAFEHAGRKYALKTIFSRARYDAGLDTYKAGLRYQLSDYTTPDNITFWVPIDPETTPVAEYSNGYDGTKLRIESGKRSVDITAETGGKAKKYKLPVKDLLANWQENAKNYRRELGGAVWHFVPQAVWQPRGELSWYSRGYAVSGEQIFDGLTGRPLDAVRTCSSTGSWHGCNIGGYINSLASGLILHQRAADDGGGLNVEVMEAHMLRHLMRGELSGDCKHSNCAKPNFELDDW